jgi:hypothetical protein
MTVKEQFASTNIGAWLAGLLGWFTLFTAASFFLLEIYGVPEQPEGWLLFIFVVLIFVPVTPGVIVLLFILKKYFQASPYVAFGLMTAYLVNFMAWVFLPDISNFGPFFMGISQIPFYFLWITNW